MISRLLAVGVLFCVASFVIIAYQTSPIRFVFKDADWNTIETAGRIAASPAQTAILGRLEGPRDLDYLTIAVSKPQEVVLRLRVDASVRDFFPELILFGRGLPASTGIGLPVGDQNGAIVGRVDAQNRKSVFDIQTMSSYTEGPLIRATLPSAGTYAVVIRSPQGVSGRYTLIHGTVPDRSFDGWRSFLTGSVRAILRMY